MHQGVSNVRAVLRTDFHLSCCPKFSTYRNRTVEIVNGSILNNNLNGQAIPDRLLCSERTTKQYLLFSIQFASAFSKRTATELKMSSRDLTECFRLTLYVLTSMKFSIL